MVFDLDLLSFVTLPTEDLIILKHEVTSYSFYRNKKYSNIKTTDYKIDKSLLDDFNSNIIITLLLLNKNQHLEKIIGLEKLILLKEQTGLPLIIHSKNNTLFQPKIKNSVYLVEDSNTKLLGITKEFLNSVDLRKLNLICDKMLETNVSYKKIISVEEFEREENNFL